MVFATNVGAKHILIYQTNIGHVNRFWWQFCDKTLLAFHDFLPLPTCYVYHNNTQWLLWHAKELRKGFILYISLLLWVEKEQRSSLISFCWLWCTKKLNVWSHPTTITKLQKAPKKDRNPRTHPKVLIANTSKKPTIRIRSKALMRGKL
jgi:hypothetical protein